MKKLAKLFAGLMAAAFIFASCSNPVEPPANTIGAQGKGVEATVAKNQAGDTFMLVFHTKNGLDIPDGSTIPFDENAHKDFVIKNVTIKYQLDGGKVKEIKKSKLDLIVNHPYPADQNMDKMAGWQLQLDVKDKLEEGQQLAFEFYGTLDDGIVAEELKLDVIENSSANGWSWAKLAADLPVVFLEPEAAQGNTTPAEKVELDLSGVKQGTFTNDVLAIQNLAQVDIPIGKVIPKDTEVKCKIEGNNKGSAGFRCWLAKGSGRASAVSQDKTVGTALPTGAFTVEYLITIDGGDSSADSADTFVIKGKDWQTNIDDIEITKVTLSWGGDDEEAAAGEIVLYENAASDWTNCPNLGDLSVIDGQTKIVITFENTGTDDRNGWGIGEIGFSTNPDDVFNTQNITKVEAKFSGSETTGVQEIVIADYAGIIATNKYLTANMWNNCVIIKVVLK